MSRSDAITARQREILTAVVESYIATGEPVSSGSLARSAGNGLTSVSSATLRSEMAELAEAGLLEQPHTSAGRLPSARGLGLYVQQLTDGAAAGLPGPLRAEMKARIDTGFADLAAGGAGTAALLQRTSQVLARLSSGVGMAMDAPRAADLLEHVHFSVLAERRVLAVVVTRAGGVRDRVLQLDREMAPGELQSAARLLNEHFCGWSLHEVRAELERRLLREQTEYAHLLESAQHLWQQAVPEGAATGHAVYVEGVANLVAAPGSRAQLRDLLQALEAKGRVVELLNAYIDAAQASVRVVFDLEAQAPEMAGLVLVAAPARMAGETVGTVGVLGLQRMDYGHTMHAVAYVAERLNRMLDGR